VSSDTPDRRSKPARGCGWWRTLEDSVLLVLAKAQVEVRTGGEARASTGGARREAQVKGRNVAGTEERVLVDGRCPGFDVTVVFDEPAGQEKPGGPPQSTDRKVDVEREDATRTPDAKLHARRRSKRPPLGGHARGAADRAPVVRAGPNHSNVRGIAAGRSC
jgi:hypothetical protein